MERVNVDFEGSKEEFRACVKRKTKGQKQNIAFLRNEAGVSVINTKGKLSLVHNTSQGPATLRDLTLRDTL